MISRTAPRDLPATFAQMLAWHTDAALWLPGQATALQPSTIGRAARHRLPVMVLQRDDVEAGGLISYFPDHAELFKRTAMDVEVRARAAAPGRSGRHVRADNRDCGGPAALTAVRVTNVSRIGGASNRVYTDREV